MNKNQFLKIAKVKNINEFYRKFPTEAAFKKAHGKELRKAQVGTALSGVPNQNQYMYGDLDIYGNTVGGGSVPPNPNDNFVGGNVMGGGNANQYMFGSPNVGGTPNQAPVNPNQAPLYGTNQQAGDLVNDYSIYKTYGKMEAPKNPYPTMMGAIEPPKKKESQLLNAVTKYAGPAGELVKGIKALKDEKNALKYAKQQNMVSNVALDASRTREEEQRRMYNRPEDFTTNPNQLYPTYGTGTNVLSARNGSSIGGNPSEIQNMYNPGDIYSDLGYEPLSESEIVKQYQMGGYVMPTSYVPQAQNGITADQFTQFMGGAGGQAINQFAGDVSNNNAGSSVGGTLGGTLGSAFGPAGKAIGKVAGTLIGGALDRKPAKTQKLQEKTIGNVMGMALNRGAQGVQNQYSSFVRNGGNIPSYEEGGWVSHDWQPQVITQFGEHPMSHLLAPDKTMDTLRTGGRITQNNKFPQDQYALGGELKTTWGGHTESISHNPYLPGTGETVMFRGKSHEESDGNGHTGIGVKYGQGEHDDYTDYAEYGTEAADADVEVERNEPAAEMIDPQTGEKSMVVYGNLFIPNHTVEEIGDPNAKGKKFKNYVADLAKKEDRQNKIIEKTNDELSKLNIRNPIDRLKFNAQTAMLQGANNNLAQYAEFKTNAAIVQNAINDTSEQHGIDADAFAKGKIKFNKQQSSQAKFGKEIFKAVDGVTTPVTEQPSTVDPVRYAEIKKLYDEAAKEGAGNKKSAKVKEFQQKFHEYFPEFAKEVIFSSPLGVTSKSKSKYKTIEDLKKASDKDILSSNVDEYFGPRTQQYMAKLEEKRKVPATETPKITIPETTTVSGGTPDVAKTTTTTIQETPPNKLNKWMNVLNTISPYLTKPYQETLDPAQLYGEMYALGSNQLEPVPSQQIQPQLDDLYEINRQKAKNDLIAQTRAAQRMTGYDPSVQAAIAAQAYEPMQALNEADFIANQQFADKIYSGNRAQLRDVGLKNMGIAEQQYGRQAQAKSNTKAVTQAALSSMADKIAQNKLENRKFAAASNLFPQYGFNKNMKAVNQGLTYFNNPVVGGNTGMIPVVDQKSGQVIKYVQPGEETTTDETATTPITTIKKKNGASLKKDLKNSSIVRAIKNL